MNNKKAEKLFSIWWFFVLTIVGGGIVIGVLINSAIDVNIKEVESNILSERIIDCMVDNGYLIDLGSFDVFENCNINEDLFIKGSNYYFNISVFDNEENIFELTKGSSFEKDCKIQEKVDAEKFPRCSKKIELVIYNGKQVNLIVLTASNQNGRRISVLE